MSFDKEDVPTFASLWESVILHEMGHVLGIGTLWNIELVPGRPFRLVDPPFTPTDYIGANGQTVWSSWGCSGNPPIETDGGR